MLLLQLLQLVLLQLVLHLRCEQWLPARSQAHAMRQPCLLLTSAGCAVLQRRLRQEGLLVLLALLVLLWVLCCRDCAVEHGLLLAFAVLSVMQGWGCGLNCGLGLRWL